jgi:hypothetical protein
MIRFGPFEKFDLRHKLRPNPGALLYVGGGQPFTPAPFLIGSQCQEQLEKL